jgi:hypothetical protein
MGLGDRLADQAASLLGHDAVVMIIRLQNAGKLANCGTPAWERFTGVAEAGDVEIAAVILSRDHEYVCEDHGARRVREDPAARPIRRNSPAKCALWGLYSRRADRWRSRSPMT